MSDLSERLCGLCNCNIDESPCGAEDECRLMYEAADALDAKDATLSEAQDAIERLREDALRQQALREDADDAVNDLVDCVEAHEATIARLTERLEAAETRCSEWVARKSTERRRAEAAEEALASVLERLQPETDRATDQPEEPKSHE